MATTVVIITSGTTFTVPTDFGSLISIEGLGAGGDGQAFSTTANTRSFGGGGGAYAAIASLSGIAAGNVYNIQIGARGGTVGSGTSPTANTWFNNVSTLVAAGGTTAASGAVNAPGGTTANSVGTTKFAGGQGLGLNPSCAGGGGGGAAGSTGAGANGGAASNSANGGGGGGGGSNGGSSGQASTGLVGVGGTGGNNRLATGGGAAGDDSSPPSAAVAGSNGGGGGGGGSDLQNGDSSPGGNGAAGGNGTEWTTAGSGGGGGGGGMACDDGVSASGNGGNGGLYGAGGGGLVVSPSNPLSSPGLGAQGVIVFTYNTGAPAAVTFGYFGNLTLPVRRRDFAAADQQFLAFLPPRPLSPLAVFSYFNPLSEPVRRRIFPTSEQPFVAWPPPRAITVTFSYFNRLSEPVRTKRGLLASDQLFLAFGQPPIPTILGVLSALETKDTFLAGALIWNTVQSAEIGVIPANNPVVEVGFVTDTPATANIVSVKVSVRMS